MQTDLKTEANRDGPRRACACAVVRLVIDAVEEQFSSALSCHVWENPDANLLVPPSTTHDCNVTQRLVSEGDEREGGEVGGLLRG